jgi:O-succinylhomoserine sulfhydrylase
MAAAFQDDSLDVNIYSRFSNPSVDEFVDKVVLLEGAEAGVATGTGMAAVFATFMTFLSKDDHILSASAVFGSTHTLLTKYLPKWGIESTYFDMTQPETIEALIRPNTKMLYVETPSNPGLDIIDLALLGDICKKHDILYVVDNCFATPVVQQPILFGADLVIHSATKFMDGQGRVLGGVVVGKSELIYMLYLMVRNTGPSLSPFNAWVLSKSLETLHLRMERHCENGEKIAHFLASHPKIDKVYWLGSGDIGLVAFVLVKPVTQLSIRTITAPVERQCFTDFTDMPPIADDAYLNFVVLPPGTVAASNIQGYLQTVWG